MPTNDFKVWAATATNIETQAAYLADPGLANGVGSGIGSSAQANKIWRQATIIAAMIGQFISDKSGQNATDDGTTVTLEANFTAGLQAAATGRLLRTSIYDNLSGTLRVSIDGGAFANAGSSAFTPLATTTQVEFELQGGGGGGGGALIAGPSQVSAGGGGAAGGWLHKRVPVATVAAQTITVGAAGVGAAGLAGTSGGSTSIGAVASATGGNGGSLGAAAAITGSPTGGSNGGTASGGDINGAGQPGTYAFYTNPPVSGFGGGSVYGAGANGVTGTAGGNASQSYGAGGGGGALVPSAGANAAGGPGKCGLVIFREYA